MASKRIERRLKQATKRYEIADVKDRETGRLASQVPLSRRQIKSGNSIGRGVSTRDAKAERIDLSHHDDKHSVERSKYLLKNVINPNDPKLPIKWNR